VIWVTVLRIEEESSGLKQLKCIEADGFMSTPFGVYKYYSLRVANFNFPKS